MGLILIYQQKKTHTHTQIIVDEDRSHIDDSKLSAIRMKLEEHRRHILQEKRKMEFALSRQQQKVGKAAFFQAINKVSSLCLGNLTTTVSLVFSS